jgi:hypothetical protein
MSNEDYRKLQMETEAIMNEKGYTIEVVHHSSREYIFNSKVKNTTDDIASYIEVYTGEDDIKTKTTRADNKQSLPTFTISSVETSLNHRGKSLALLLISYAICYLKQIYSNTHYVLLDDCSENSHKIKKNLYHKLGFIPRDHVALLSTDSSTESTDSSTELKLCGPEKQLLLDKGFLQKARDVNYSLHQRMHLSHIITKAKRILKSAALEQQKKNYAQNNSEVARGKKSRKKHKKHKKHTLIKRKHNKRSTSISRRNMR